MSEWYLFAAFVFLLAALLVWFYKRTPRSQRKREEKSFEREVKLFKLYQNIEDLMDGFEAYVEELQRTLGQDSEDIKRRVEALEAQHAALRHALRIIGAQSAQAAAQESVPESPAVSSGAAVQPTLQPLPRPVADPAQAPFEPVKARAEEAGAAPTPAPSLSEAKKRRRNAPLNRAQKVRILQAEGMDAVSIAKELGLSLNEVNLIMQLEERPDASLH